MINKILRYSVKNKKFLNKQTGQILIIFLLILVVGLALVLSVASRSITDIRTATTSDESSRAYFAAEAGVEEALKRLESTPSFTGTELDFSTVNQTKAKVSASDLEAGATAFLVSDNFQKDSVEQISLLTDFNDIGSGSPVSNIPNGKLQVWWGDGVSTPPAIEVTVVGYNSGTYSIAKFAFDSQAGRRSQNKFCNPTGGAVSDLPTDQGVFNFDNNEIIDIRAGYLADACGLGSPANPGIGNDTPVLARIKLLYNTDGPNRVAVQGFPVSGAGSWALPKQGVEIESTGEHVSGVTRKLKVTQRYPSLPSIFDYVLFSGSDLTK